jgi:hypothetical protein
MDQPAQAEAQVTTPAEKEAELDARIAKSAEAHAARLGVATENASAETQESEESTEAAAEAESAQTDEAESEAKVAEKKESDEPRVFTAEELGDPKFFYSLDKKGWADLEAQHPVVAAGFKSVQSEMTRREKNVKERERVLAERETPKSEAAPAKPAAVTVDKAELIDALNDPERVDEAIEKFADLPGFEKAIDRYLAKRGVNVDALKEVSATDVFQSGFKAAAKTNPALIDEAVVTEIENESDPRIAAMLQSNEASVVAFGFELAADRALVRLGKTAKPAAKTTAEATKPDKLEAAKAAAKKAIAKNPKQITPASTDAGKAGSSVRVDDKSIPLDKRIEASAARHANELAQRRGSTLG